MKNLIKKISILLMLNSFANGAIIVTMVNESPEIKKILADSIINDVKRDIKNLYYDKENFYLKVRCNIDYNGKFVYKGIAESEGGYNNKILVIKKLEDIKQKGFYDEMKMIQKIDKKNEDTPLYFYFDITQE